MTNASATDGSCLDLGSNFAAPTFDAFLTSLSEFFSIFAQPSPVLLCLTYGFEVRLKLDTCPLLLVLVKHLPDSNSSLLRTF